MRVYVSDQNGQFAGPSNIPISGLEIVRELGAPVRATFETIPGTDITPWASRVMYTTPTGSLIDTVVSAVEDDPEAGLVKVETIGPAGTLAAVPYVGAVKSFTQTDPVAIAGFVVSQQATNGFTPSGLKVEGSSRARVGVPVKKTQFTTGSGENVDFETGPVIISPWTVTDCLDTIKKLFTTAGMDWTETTTGTTPDTTTTAITCHPAGWFNPRQDLTYIEGLNITVKNTETTGQAEISDVIVTGAGEGAKQIRAHATRTKPGIRRTKIVTDKNITSPAVALAVANQHLATAGNIKSLEIEIYDHPAGNGGTLNPGDRPRWKTRHGTFWGRVTSTTWRPTEGTTTTKIETTQ